MRPAEVVTTDESGDDEESGYPFAGLGRNLPAPDNPQGMIMYGFCGAIVIVVLSLFLSSFQGLHATKFALTRNAATGVVNFGSTYHGGRNFIGFWNNYLEFPADLQSIEWLDGTPPYNKPTRDLSPMQVRTSDGLMVKLGLVTQYQINKEHLSDIYRTFKLDIEGYFISNLRSQIQETIAQFRATELYENRIMVADSLMKMCQDVCKADLKGYLTCWRIDLLEVGLDQKIEDANIREQVEKQKQKTEMMIQQASLIRAESEVIEADYARLITVVDGNATAQAYSLTQEAVANALNAEQLARAEALAIIQSKVTSGTLKMTTAQQLQYLEKLTLIENPGGGMVYGDFNSASVFMPKSEL
mmetsp:Transcript_11979/g.42806  ORF Transcript_11979/g.42806 Transcript_11979/m.42806 type:complete len:358 (-) Transcript_11979:189-1262(-)